MKRNLLGVCLVLLIGLLPVVGEAWIGDSSLQEIEWRIEETERRMLDLDKELILNRIDWANWAIDLLNDDVREMEKEIEKARKRWEEAKKCENAWREWEKVGRELDGLERKKSRLDSVLERVKCLKQRLEERLRALERPKPQFALGLGALMVKDESSFTVELGFTPIPKAGFFLGGGLLKREYYWGEIEYKLFLSHVGAEFYPLSFGKVKFPVVGLLYLFETNDRREREYIYSYEIEKGEVKPFVGLRFEGPVAKGYGFFFQVRGGPSLVTLVGGLTF